MKTKKKLTFDPKKCFFRNFANFVEKIILGARPLSCVEKSIFRPAFFLPTMASDLVQPRVVEKLDFSYKITIFTHQYWSDGSLIFFKILVCEKPKI